MGRQRALIDVLLSLKIIGNAGGICASFLTTSREDSQQLMPLLSGELVAVIYETKQTAPTYTSASATTGSLTYNLRSFRY